MLWRWVRLGSCIGMLLAVATWSAAEDLNPPGYRGLGNTTSAEWEFPSPGGPYFPSGGTVPLVVGDTGPPAPGLGTPFPFCVLFMGATWVPPGAIAGPGTIACNIPNWKDNEPVKRQRVQVTYKGPKPSIRKFCFLGVPGSSDAVTETLITEVADTTLGLLSSSGGYFYQDWECRPNPDWEQVVVDLLPGTVVDQLVVDTISAPLARRFPTCRIIVTPSPGAIRTHITNPDEAYQIAIELENLDVGQIVGGSVKLDDGTDITGPVLQASNIVPTPTGAIVRLPFIKFPRDFKRTARASIQIRIQGVIVNVSDDVTIDTPK
jgi:hypothetical protein